MATIIIIGAGLGGMSAAYELKAELGKQHDVILVNDKPDFEFNPSNPWIAVRWRERKDISLPIEPHVKKKGIRWLITSCRSANNIMPITFFCPRL